MDFGADGRLKISQGPLYSQVWSIHSVLEPSRCCSQPREWGHRIGLRPDSKRWCRDFHLWKRWELQAKGLGSDVVELTYKDGNTASGEGLAYRTLWTPRDWSILSLWVCQVFLDVKMLRRNWRVRLGAFHLETRTALGNKSTDRLPPDTSQWCEKLPGMTTRSLVQCWFMGRNLRALSTHTAAGTKDTWAPMSRQRKITIHIRGPQMKDKQNT